MRKYKLKHLFIDLNVLISAVQQSDSVIQTYIYMYVLYTQHTQSLLKILCHYGVSHDIEYSRTLLFVHSPFTSLHLLIPNSHSIPPTSRSNRKSVLYDS